MIFIFDIGNVLINFDLPKLLQNISDNSHTPVDKLLPIYSGPQLQKAESGQIEGTKYFEYLITMTGLKWSYNDWIDAWADVYEINEPGLSLLKELKAKKYPVCILSNLADYNVDAINKKMPQLLKETDRNFYSFELGHLKPTPQIYQKVSELLSVPPQNCLFLDDTQKNVEGAISAGMNSLLYSNNQIEEIKSKINKFLENTP